MRPPLLLLVLLLISGCGGRAHARDEGQRPRVSAIPQETTLRSGRRCELAEPGGRRHEYRTCWGPDVNHPNPTIERRTRSGWALVTGPLKPAAIDALWGRVWLSPDRRTVLAEWRYPCDSGTVVFVAAHGGRPRIVTGEADWRKAPVAQGRGWTHDGKARVQVVTRWRGHAAGVYLFDPHALKGDERPLRQSGC